MFTASLVCVFGYLVICLLTSNYVFLCLSICLVVYAFVCLPFLSFMHLPDSEDRRLDHGHLCFGTLLDRVALYLCNSWVPWALGSLPSKAKKAGAGFQACRSEQSKLNVSLSRGLSTAILVLRHSMFPYFAFVQQRIRKTILLVIWSL